MKARIAGATIALVIAGALVWRLKRDAPAQAHHTTGNGSVKVLTRSFNNTVGPQVTVQ